jgi:urease accessory protein
VLLVNKLLPQGQGLSAVLLKRAATVAIDWATRQCAEFDTADQAGRALQVRLPEGSVLREGDVLVAEDGALLRVQAAAEAVMEVRPCPDHGSPRDLPRAAYQLGQRHVPVAVHADRLTLRPDAELAALLRAQHLQVSEAHAPFEPETAWHSACGHAHHGHDHDAHDHRAHDHGAHAHHTHGAGCGHDHGHDHQGHAHHDHTHHGHRHGDPHEH